MEGTAETQGSLRELTDGSTLVSGQRSDGSVTNVARFGADGRRQWTTQFPLGSAIAEDNDHRIYLQSLGRLTLLDLSTGAAVWNLNHPDAGFMNRLSTNLLAADGRLYVSYYQGTRYGNTGTYALDLASGAVAWKSASQPGTYRYLKTGPANLFVQYSFWQAAPLGAAFQK